MILILFAALALGVCGDGSRLGTTAALHDGCRDASMSLVQSQASRRGTVAAFLQLGPKPWEERYYYVGAHHKSGTELLRAVMRHAFDTLHAPSSCHYWKPGVKPTPAHFITSTDHDAYCFDRLDIPIQFDPSANLQRFAAAKGAAVLRELPIRGVHAVRKPKDMLISAYCYHHRGQEYGDAVAPWPEIMSMSPVQGLMALWPAMSGIIQDMLDFYTNTSSDEVFHMRFEEVTSSSQAFDEVVQRLFRFLFAPAVPESDLSRMWQAAKVEDLNSNPTYANAIASSDHSNKDDCMQAAQESLLQLDPRVVQILKDTQEQLGYSIENWPDALRS
ncbi:GIP [Symbiodinium natans]|uniref:GIP protein n=1 Tax=Symbiodinium natans TaxID=878477 RepID=A0A812LIN9_9DINO|nr:GIP [Symbiodinium natans]